MTIELNNKTFELPAECRTIHDLVALKNIPQGGTAISVNDRLVRHADWASTELNDNDRVIIISAAFGG